MKKNKKRSVKLLRQSIKNDIALNLTAKLKEVTADIGQASKKLEKQIEKGSDKLARKILRELKIDKTIASERIKELDE